MVSGKQTYCETIRDHYSRRWAQEPELVKFARGPIHDLPSGFRVLRFAPSTSRSMWTYATVCMSQPQDQNRLELHMFAPARNDDLGELLVATAHYHRTGQELGLGHSVNFGRPWWPGSHCDRGLVSLPYLDGPHLERLETYGETVRFLWLIPVTKSEVDFKKESGFEALEKKFDEGRLNYLDPLRASAV